MTDTNKTCLSMFFFLSMLFFPFIGLAIGWIGWDFQTGVIIASITFAIFFLLGGIILTNLKDYSWFTVSLPFLSSFIYTIAPDFIIGPFDDAVAMTAGAILSFTLWIRKQPETPRWIIFPLLLSGIYALVGSFIPGPVDELIIMGISTGTAALGGLLQNGNNLKKADEHKDPEILNGEFVDSE